MSEDESRFELTRRGLLSSTAAIGLATAGAGAGTMAYFSESDQSTDNTIQADTLNLVVGDGDENFGDGVSGTWTISNAKPGDTVAGNAFLQNSSSLTPDHVEFDVSVAETESNGPNGNNESDTSPNTATGMAEQFEITQLEYDNQNLLSDISDANGNGNGIVDLGDIVSGNDGALDGLSPPPKTGYKSLVIDFRWAHDTEFDTTVSGVNNDYQGDDLDITVTMTLQQDSSQDV